MQSSYMLAVRGIADQQDSLMHSLSTAPPSSAYSIKPESLLANSLYLCNKRKEHQYMYSEGGSGKQKPSMEALQQSYKALNSRKVKETLSSFLPDIPGDFDSMDIPDTTLRGLIEHPPVGGSDFLPLNGQALLGFRLVPGSLPEKYRMDPTPLPTPEVKRHHKKKRHKHKAIDRTDAGTLSSDQPPASVNTHAVPDPLVFIHPEVPQLYPSHPAHLPTAPPALPLAAPPPKAPSYSGAVPITSATVTPTPTPTPTPLGVSPGKKRKKKHENGEGQPKKKKKRDKDKKKKKDKHHNQNPPPVQATPLPSHVPATHTAHASFPHQPM